MNMMKKGKLIGIVFLLLIAVLGVALPAAAEETALLQKYQAMVAKNPDLDVEIILAGTFHFDEGDDDVSTSARCHYTHDPMAYFTEVGYRSFSASQAVKTVCMLYGGEHVIYAWNDEPGGKRLKRKTTQDALAGMLEGPPVLSLLASIAHTHESAASLEGASVTIWLTPEEGGQFIQESGLSFGNIVMEVTASEPVALLYQFDGHTDQISEIQLSCPTAYEYRGMRVEGSVSLSVRFLEIGEVSPVEMPEEADSVPFS